MIDTALLEQLQITAHAAAWAAGKVIQEKNDQPRMIRFKGLRDIVTDTDTAAQQAAIDVIRNRFPDHRILAEEDPDSKPDDDGVWHLPDGVAWIIDPLDGTSNYANALPLVSVSIGVTIDGEPVVGVIFDPLRDEMFEAATGTGAILNGRKLEPIKPIPMADSLVNHDWARAAEARTQVLDTVMRLAPACRTMRAMGSAALGLAYVAAGRVQLHFNYGLMPWDSAAGAVIVHETGGEIRCPDGSPWQVGTPALMAAHPALLDEAFSLMR